MLEILNRYAHGLAAIPLLAALRERGCLARLAAAPASAEDLAAEFSANRGYLDVALRMMVCLEWLRPTANGAFEATADLANVRLIPPNIMDLYHFPFDRYVEGEATEPLEPWIERVERLWDDGHPFLADYLDGLMIIPLFLALRAQQRLRIDGDALVLDVEPTVARAIERLFTAKRWAARTGDALQVTRAGRFVVDRIFVTATLASYMPMFGRAEDLLFGDAASVFTRDEDGHETHVDRTINVIGSGFQHGKFFAALSDIILRCFDDENYESQPKYIVDMGCGDGTLLLRLYEAIRDRSRRGKVLDLHPVVPVAVDFNEKALIEASKTLNGIPHLAVRGDIGDPAALLETLRASGVNDLHRVLHVRSFLDHDRPYKQPEDRAAAERRPQTGGNVYIDQQGRLIPLGEMVQSTVEHLRRWAQVVNEHGLVLLEVHCLPPDVTARYRDESENFHFDVYHALSHQFLLDAQMFASCAAEAGLFWREGRSVGFPKHLPYKRITLNHFERRPYLVRRALNDDRRGLAELQELWPQRRPRAEGVEGEFLLEAEGRVLASIHCEEHAGAVRVVSAAARPEAPAAYVRELLQFVEHYWALTDCGTVAGLDDCRAALPDAEGEPSVVRAVARDVRQRVAARPFAAENDPRAAESELGTFAFRWMLATLQKMGVFRDAGEAHEVGELITRLGVAPKYHRYFEALVRRMESEGLVIVRDGRVEATALVRERALTSVDEQVAEFRQQFSQRHPATAGLMNLTLRGLSRFEEILTGRAEITGVIFENGNMDLFTDIFRGGVVSDHFNFIIAESVRDAVIRLRATRPRVRILEIGAGTGATTAAILEAIEPLSNAVEFCFTDISQSFLRHARRRFSERHPYVEYRQLDIEKDPVVQGFEPHTFDIVVAANVLHDTRTVDHSLKQVHRLLRADGLLVVDEYTFAKTCLLFSGALLHGYWLFEDPENRLPDSCLLSVPQWIRALERCGFAVAGTHVLPTQSIEDPTCSQSVILCEALPAPVEELEPPRPQAQAAKEERLAALVERHALALLGPERAAAYGSQRPVMDMGLDSLELVELKSLLERSLGVKLTPMFLFEHETPVKLASALAATVTELPDSVPAPSAAAATSQKTAAITDKPVAVEAQAKEPVRESDSQKTSRIGAYIEKQALVLLGSERAPAYARQRPLMDMGLDSLELVELKSLLERGLGVKLTPMFLFEHETTVKLAAALAEIVPETRIDELPPADKAPAVRTEAQTPAAGVQTAATTQAVVSVAPSAGELAEAAAREGEEIAIVGVACRFPGGALSPQKFWKLLEEGKSGIAPMPAGRWRWPAFIDPAGAHKGIDRAGFLERIDEFDAAFFRTSPKEANLMDPQQRLLLELSWEAIEDGGHRPSELSGRKIGVFIGVCHYDYREVLTAAVDPADAYVGTGSALSLLANRLSYFYDFKGPSLTVDTACSSSLFALHHAFNAIRRGDCEQALVGAANLLCSPTNSIAYYRAGMLSPSGTCRTFDESADGYVRGEGGAMLLLKPLSMALADGDAVYGLVKGTAVNHGGQAVSLTAPKPEAQAAVIEAAWSTANVPLQSIGYIEAHGTGTRLGDPIEIGGLIEGFGRLSRARGETWTANRCGLGSVKTNIGHLEGAAGLAGLIKVLLAMQHRSIPASLHIERINPDIDLTGSPFHVVRRNEEWVAGRDAQGRELPRTAGVSSFGFGGSNAHAVIEELPLTIVKRGVEPGVEPAADHAPHLIILSAKNEERLIEQGQRLLEFLISMISEGDPSTAPRLADLAYTLQTGREAMDVRVAFVVRSREELIAALHTWTAGSALPNCYRGQVDPRRARGAEVDERREEIESSLAKRDLAKIALLWVNGAEVDWARLAYPVRPRRVHLPTYPFAKERHWIEPAPAEAVAGGMMPSAAAAGMSHPLMHPLLHLNSSNLSQQSYSAVFRGDEFFLADHQVREGDGPAHKVLPGVAYLEMVRAAVEAAAPARADSPTLELRNTVWLQPIVADAAKQVSIALLVNDDGHIDFEFYSQDAEREIVHCQGQAVLSQRPASAAIDPQQIARRVEEDRLEPAGVYAGFARRGLVYGPAFQALTDIHLGGDQVLARLRLPKSVEDTSEDYVLHPSLMDGALQAAVVLLDRDVEARKPRLPFVLESLRVVSPCTRQMLAWVRYAGGSRPGSDAAKIDIDLCDESGTVCVEMRGLSLRIPSRGIEAAAAPSEPADCVLAAPVWQTAGVGAEPVEYAAHHVLLCELSKVEIEKLESLLPQWECLSVHTAPQDSIAQRYSSHALTCFERIRAIFQSKPQGRVLLQVVISDHQEQILLSGLSGILRTATLENPQFTGQVILVRPQTTSEELAPRLRDEASHGLDPVARYENGSRHVLRWQEVPYAGKAPVEFKDHGVYLITGGFGGLGLLFAREILEHTRHARVVLTGRSVLSAEKQALRDELSVQGGRLSYRQSDIRDLEQVKRLITAVREEYRQVNGILHGAGIIADDFILRKSGSQFAEVLAPKVAGTYNLDEASRDVELDFFVLFSSIASALGNLGQADYAAANAFMDQYAVYRNRLVAAGQRHGRTLSINWPYWRDGGMSIDPVNLERLEKTLGMQAMHTKTGMQAFHRSLALPYDQILVMEGDAAQIRQTLLAGSTLSNETEEVVPAEVVDRTLTDKTQRFLRKKFSGHLKMPAHKIDPQTSLRDFGVDSILAMQLINELEETFGSLSKTLFFEYQTIRELAEYFGTHHSRRLAALFAATSGRSGDSTPSAAVAGSVAAAPAARRRFMHARSAAPAQPAESEPIAIIGLSGRYPESIDVETFWNNLRDGKDCIVEVPRERWDWQAYFAADRTSTGRHYSKWGGFISGIDEFDPLFFNISPREAQYIDPQERLFLQHAWMAVEDAGYTRASLQIPHERDLPGQVGVYVGVMWSEYQLYGTDAASPDRKMGFAGNVASIANRVSYVLNLHGPSVTLDTMCSSSLSAIHYACQDLKLGRTSMAIAGGVNVSVHPNKYLLLSVGQFISSDGHCQSFGEGGDGYIPGEGVGAVVLKRLSDAKRDGDHIYGLIRGSALNHGGRTSGYTVPSPQAQASVIGRALADARVDARHVSYIEAHGTGTKLGDPIEIAALGKAFAQYTQDRGFCLIGSAKSNIGHCESAAGIAGLTKVLLQMQHEEIVPSLHSAQLNPHIDFDDTPFIVNQSLRPWDVPVIDGRALPRIAGISSFGAGGSNAHMILEEYRSEVRTPSAGRPVVVPLSARTGEQLREKVRDLLRFVTARAESLDLVSMAYTLQIGREAMEERFAAVVSSADQLIERLEAFLAGEDEIEDAYRGDVRHNRESLSLFTPEDLQQTIERWIANGQLARLADLWSRGMELDWSLLYGDGKPRRMSLPAYPFAKERYWIDAGAGRRIGTTTAVLHPLLHGNTSNLSEQRYSSTFRGDEHFLADHQVAGRKVLPAVAYLEMARAAIEDAASHEEPRALELRDVVWAQPVIVDEATRVTIALMPAGDDEIDYEIYSGDDAVHCQGRAFLGSQFGPVRLDLEQLAASMTEGVTPESLYAACARMGLDYGPSFRGVTELRRGRRQVLARLSVPSAALEQQAQYVLHPSLMDSALQASVALSDETTVPRLPFALRSLRILSPCASEMTAWVRYRGENDAELDVDLCDVHGNVAVELRGLSLRAAAQAGSGRLLAAPVWQTSGIDSAAAVDFAEHHVLALHAEPSDTPAERYSRGALACFERVQAIFQSRPQGRVLLQVVTTDELLAGLTGMLRTAALENPRFVGQLLLLPQGMTPAEQERLLEEEKGGALDSVVRYQDGVRQVLGWQEISVRDEQPPSAFRDGGAYLITGGRGGLGSLFANEILARTHNAHVVLTGRSSDAGALGHDPRVTYRQLDLGDAAAVRELIASILAEHGSLHGILHSAGQIADHFIMTKTASEFAAVLAPKVAGTFHLDEATRDVELDFFVLFSSFAGAMGNPGQADYAAANGFMDRFAAYRNRLAAAGRRHGRARSINWPLWQAGGMTLEKNALDMLRQATGMEAMQTSTGLDAFHRIVAMPQDQVLVAEGDLARLRRTVTAKRAPQPAPAAIPAATVPALEAGSLLEKAQQYFQRQFSELLKVPAQRIDPQAALEEYGIDSVLALQLINKLEQSFGALSKTLLFEYPTIRDLSRHFVSQHAARLQSLFAPAAAAVTVSTMALAETRPDSKPVVSRRFRREKIATPAAPGVPEPIAIIGLSGRYPEAFDLEQYWQNLREGKDCIVEVPKERWDWREYFSEDRTQEGRHYSKWGGFIAGADEFDPLFFNISPKEAKLIDPQERLFLQHAWMAIEDAGYTRAALQGAPENGLGGQVGVYAGVMWDEYQLFGVEASAQGRRLGIGGSTASIANRVSYVLNLHGPSMTVDTMCSSSLTAIHLACQDLRSGRCTLAIAGGVNVSVHPNKYLVLSAGQFISSDGHCQSFGEGGDGYIPGEGVGVVILKRLSDARRDGDHIYAIIRGSALNHGGKTNGYTVPNPQAQASAVSQALAEAKIDPRHVSYIEAHGTGTKLGDPIEIAALNKAFQQHTQDAGFCLIGSAKSNIGHCESAAGIAGLTKVVLQMQHREIVPSLHSEQLNPHIDFAATSFVVNQTLRPWDPPLIDGRTLPRIAGISSFGAGGSNAHMIVEEYPESPASPMPTGSVIIPLSARTAEQLRQRSRDLLDYLRKRSATIDLATVAYTLQTGREAMDERAGFVVTSIEQLIERLQAFVDGRQDIEDAWQGQVRRNKEALAVFSADDDLQATIEKWIAGRKLARLADLWVKGLEIEWNKLWDEPRPRRISLPVYPFARERYWIDVTIAPPAAPAAVVRSSDVQAAAAVHPLLQRNASDLSGQRYRSTFTGSEFFLADHRTRLNGQSSRKTLPPAAYLEMVRAAITHALPERPESGVVELRNMVWAPPSASAGAMDVAVSLWTNEQDEIEFEISSESGDEEIVHCQGSAIMAEGAAPAVDLARIEQQMDRTIDPAVVQNAAARAGLVAGTALWAITAIRAGHGELLVRLRRPDGLDDSAGAFVLHPSLLHSAMHASVALLGDSSSEPRLPLALDALRVASPCAREMVAWIRPSTGNGAAIDVDLCDARGNVAAQLRGLHWQPVAIEPSAVMAESIAPSAAPSHSTHTTLVRREVILTPLTESAPASLERKKGGAIALNAPSASVPRQTSHAARVRITLSTTTPASESAGALAPTVSPLRLYDCGTGVFSLEIVASRASDMVSRVLHALDRAEQDSSLKLLLIHGIEHCFTRGGREELNEALAQRLLHRLAAFPFPTIAVLHADVIGGGFLAAALCDFMVCNEEAHYAFSDPEHDFHPTAAEAMLFRLRFGAARGEPFAYAAGPLTGRQLRDRGWTCPILPWTKVEEHAEKLAVALADKSRDALRLLKAHLARELVTAVEALRPVEPAVIDEDEAAPAMIASSDSIRVHTAAERVFVVELRGGGDLVADLRMLFAEVERRAFHKAIVLAGDGTRFMPDDLSDDAVLDLERIIVQSEIPVVAALTGNARGNAWLAAQLCDAAVYSREGLYSAAGIAERAQIAPLAVAAFGHRFTREAASEILLSGGDYAGATLEKRLPWLIAADHNDVLSSAIRIAASLTATPRPTLTEWKRQTAVAIDEAQRTLSIPSGWDEADAPPITAPAAVSLQSRVVTVTAHPGGIAVVKMEDRDARNMFSDALVSGVREAFAHIAGTPSYKTVILIGYDNYFASGGTRESLLSIQEGKSRFTDFEIFHAALECRLPVIAAMQGHGIGAGWSMGMLADVVLLSEESRYVSPYMNYGFTPGAGATYSLTEKMGRDLANESLLTGQQVAGRELKERGVALRVLPRTDVAAEAMSLAERMARRPRGALIALKQLLRSNVRETLEETYRRELAMHDETFVGRQDTLAQILSHFHEEIEPAPSAPALAHSEPARISAGGDSLAAVTAALRTLLAQELQMQEVDIDESAQFVDLGLDSITGVTWIRKINEKFGTAVEATKVYSYPTLAQLSRHVHEEAEKQGSLPTPTSVEASVPAAVPATVALSPAAARPAGRKLTSRRRRIAPRAAVAQEAPRASVQPIAIIGMAGQFPQARNIDEFWRNIAQGRNCITEVPPDRWSIDEYYQPGQAVTGKTNCRWAGTLEDYDRFDPLFFNISPTEAENMDPQQRLFLQACWHAIEDAGYDARRLSGSRCGVFVGAGGGDYRLLSREQRLSAQGFMGDATSILAARISYFLNLQGPSIAIDTACSSSLVALANACDSLTWGGSDLALAGGVYVMVGPEMHIKTAQAGMLSPDGKCYTFDQRANGFVPGEGVGVVLLKRLADAERDGDIIHAVIQGWGVNQDGKTNGITAPNPESQTRLEQEVYEKYGIDPEKIQLIEAHGTGTKLGDPIEVEGLKHAFRKFTAKRDYCALGSVKSNIGHTLTAAGIAGVLKLVLALRNRQLPPTIHFEQLNEHIDLSDSPFYVNDRLQDWDLGGAEVRQAAISSFGFSGTNAHIVIGEHPARVETTWPRVSPCIVPLSARTAEQLAQKARDLLGFVRENPSVDIAAIAYTLQIGRVAMDERLGFVVDSVEQLADKLEAYLEGRQHAENIQHGQARKNRESIGILSQDEEMREAIVEKLLAQRKLTKLLSLWVRGLDFDWTRLYGDVRPRRITLPVYPFARERYWVEASPSLEASARAAHPLLHRNMSDLTEQRYVSTFNGTELFLADHRVRTEANSVVKVLPGVAYLEMARAAIAEAWPRQLESRDIEIHDTLWLKPVVVEEPAEISIALFAAEDQTVDYEICSTVDGEPSVHGQGQVAFVTRSVPPKLDLRQLRRQMSETTLDGPAVYAMFAAMGLHYGPAHQGIAAVHVGNRQALADLRLPAVAEHGLDAYVLHPSLMDSALQASIGLLVDPRRVPENPAVPFALDSIRIFAACTRDMAAWVRHAADSREGDVKLDIDLCDIDGNVCVQMRGFALRIMDDSARALADHAAESAASFDEEYYDKLIGDVLAGEMSVDEALDRS